ncbi:MAG: trypsin-like serine protease [Clostridia bacterium]|jgi:serine protease Do|nr:trypsin-like serine protease [Clostridia bacterium]
MDNNSNDYKVIDVNKIKDKKTTQISFGKSVLIPFFSGVIGTTLVIGTCFGIPQIKEKIIDSKSSTVLSTSATENNSNTLNNSLTQISLSDFSNTSINVANTVRPSIVGIQVEYTINSPFSRTSTGKAEGSGIIITEDGYILTNNHIINSSSSDSYYEISKANKVIVYLYNDETPYEAKIIGTDEQTDLAVIKIEKSNLSPATLGNSDNVKVGEFSMAIGNPLGMQSSVTSGIVSAVNRKVTDSDGKTYTLIQTDAAINSGNSGGALVNANGEVIGINTLKLSGTGIEGMGFAIPINSTKDIYEQLVQYNKVKRPYIGITGIDLDQKTADYNKLVIGVYVKQVEDFSSAQKAGIKPGDVIIEANGTKITTMEELNEIKNKQKIGDTMTVKINRNSQELTITLTLSEQP